MYKACAIAYLSRNYIYVDIKDDLGSRFKEHNAGHNKTTKPYLPFQLPYRESGLDSSKARVIEKYWKLGTGKEQLKMIRDTF